MEKITKRWRFFVKVAILRLWWAIEAKVMPPLRSYKVKVIQRSRSSIGHLKVMEKIAKKVTFLSEMPF
jgi:hypothetical protein